MTVNVLGEVEKVQNSPSALFFLTLYQGGSGFFFSEKRFARSVIRGKDCTFLSDRVV